jgi:hypothetical protein
MNLDDLSARARAAQQQLAGAVGLRLKGYGTNSTNGTAPYTLAQPGNMRLLLGCALYPIVANPATFDNMFVSLVVNADQVFDNIPAAAINPALNPNGNTVYFPIVRKLNGNDNIVFTVQGVASFALQLVLWFRPQ